MDNMNNMDIQAPAQGAQFSRYGREIKPPEQKNQIAADGLASMASMAASVRAARKNEIKRQLQANPQLMEIIGTVLKTQEDMDILNELFSEMTTGKGGKRRRRTINKRRRTNRKRTLRRRR